VENRVAIARSANTGVSGFVARNGRITKTLGLFERGFLSGEILVRVGKTFYTEFGDVFAYLCLTASAATCTAARLRRTR